MSADRIAVMPKRKLDFTSTDVTQQIVLAERIELAQWREVTLLVAVADHTITGTYGWINIWMMPDSWTPEDPTLSFQAWDIVAQNIVTYGVRIDNTTPVPSYLNTSLLMLGDNCIGAMGRLVAQGNRTAAGSLTATIMVELAGTDA